MNPFKNATARMFAWGFLGAAAALAIGADKPSAQPARSFPRYSVQFPLEGRVMAVVDNDTNTVYVYSNASEGGKLSGTLDLNETGKADLKAVLPK